MRCYTPGREGTEASQKARDTPITAIRSQVNTTSFANPHSDIDGRASESFSQARDQNIGCEDTGHLAHEYAADTGQHRQDHWPNVFGSCDPIALVSQGHQSFDDIPPTSHALGEIPRTQEYGFDCGIIDPEISGDDDTKMIFEDAGAARDYHARKQLELTSGGTDSQKRYYEIVVSINISKSFLPLSEILLSNPANLLYFHHFIDDTARLLVGHDCCSNPFRTILPHCESLSCFENFPTSKILANTSPVAISDDSLMNVFLAYSATHRAHILRHRSPSNRIESYLRSASYCINGSLNGPAWRTTSAKLGAHLLLVSMNLTCASPKESILIQQTPWHSHLRAARDLIDLRRDNPQDYDSTAFAFLTRWFLGLESMKRSGGIGSKQPLIFKLQGQGAWNSLPSTCYTVRSSQDDTCIDCLWGISRRCMIGVTKVAQLTTRTTLIPIEDKTSTGGNTITREALALRADLTSDVEKKTIYVADCDSSFKKRTDLS